MLNVKPFELTMGLGVRMKKSQLNQLPMLLSCSLEVYLILQFQIVMFLSENMMFLETPKYNTTASSQSICQ
ncbi:hypothetical protein CICLE_v10024058mg [Citrus x clementina]|uniref:Uncharacterized protein n=1 Tax=Citrus clementina TaxID=85681 RepID=V4TUR1_CITCL|nr:hypothetical protein CICLE_v10024058mg [Citrus x clementina]